MNEEQEQKENSNQNFELVKRAPEQHAVTPVPKFTTELPFFYLTKQKKLLQQDIHYEGEDAFGNPIRWDVIPNRSPKIGVPTIEAHSIFTQLIKPVMEMHRKPNGEIPEIIPLGGIRECLRMIGWKEGGWEAQGLLQGLMQIGQATCDFDFLLPTGASDENGKPTFRTIKGIFNRFSIWKIGSTHVSEEELTSENFQFDFDLADTVYIQLHKVERDIQRMQDQRYLDNEYLFSVEARARRWYELMAPKIFGVVKNRGSHCEVRYSWYIKHHHTLSRCNSRSKAVTQMNRIVGDHIASKFLDRVEYRTIKDEAGQLDLLMRYYPGPAAKESMNRVLSFLGASTLPIVLARRGRKKLSQPIPKSAELREVHNIDALVAPPVEIEIESPITPGVDSATLAKLVGRGVLEGVAVGLLANKSTEQLRRIQDWVDYWDSIRNEKRPGLLVRLIQKNEPLPVGYETPRRREERLGAENERKEAARVEDRRRAEYQEFCRHAEEQFLANFPPAELERRVEQYKAEMLAENGLWNERPTMAEQLARHTVRAQIVKSAHILSYEEFCRVAAADRTPEARPAESMELTDVASSPAPADIIPNALHAPPTNDPIKEEVFVVLDDNSSPPAL